MPIVWQTHLSAEAKRGEGLYGLIRQWLHQSAGATDLPAVPTDTQSNVQKGSVEILAEPLDAEGRCSFAVRYARPQLSDGLMWTTDIGVSEGAFATNVSIKLTRESLPGVLPRLDRSRIFPPGIVRRLLASPEIGEPSQSTIFVRSAPELDALLDRIDDPRRRSLVVVISEDNWTGRSLVDPNQLADALLGVATVVYLTKYSSLGMGKALEGRGVPQARQKLWGVYNGAVRVYRPECDFSEGSPFDHPLHLPSAVGDAGFSESLQQRCITETVHAAPPGAVDLEKLRAIRLRRLLGDGDDPVLLRELLAQAEKERDDANDQAAQAKRREEEACRDAEREKKLSNYYRRKVAQPSGRAADADDPEEAEGAPRALRYFRADNGRRPVLDAIEDFPLVDQQQALSGLAQLPDYATSRGHRSIEKVKGGTGGGELYEYRVDTKDLWLRFFFAYSSERPEVLVLHVYPKKTNQLDSNEINVARMRLAAAHRSGWA